MHEDLKDLLFVSNTVELKEDKKYLMVFKGVTAKQLEHVMAALGERGITCFGMALQEGQDLEIIEAPAETAPNRFEQAQQYTRAIKEIADSAFWQGLGRAMAINERREIFKKLAEHLGVPVDEQGNADIDREKHCYSLEEAKAILAPYRKIPLE